MIQITHISKKQAFVNVFSLVKANPSTNQIPCVFTLCFDLVTPLSKTKKSLFYMGRARCDHLNVMKEGGFPKPYHS